MGNRFFSHIVSQSNCGCQAQVRFYYVSQLCPWRLLKYRPSMISLLRFILSWASFQVWSRFGPNSSSQPEHLVARYFCASSFLFSLGILFQGLSGNTVKMFPQGVAYPSLLPLTDLYLNGYLTWSFPYLLFFSVCLTMLSVSEFF